MLHNLSCYCEIQSCKRPVEQVCDEPHIYWEIHKLTETINDVELRNWTLEQRPQEISRNCNVWVLFLISVVTPQRLSKTKVSCLGFYNAQFF